MTARTDDIIRAAVERRASTPPPWLASETMRAVRAAPQRRAETGGANTIPRISLIATAIVVVATLVGGLTIGARLLEADGGPDPGPSSASVALSPSPESSPYPSATVGEQGQTPDVSPVDRPVVLPPANGLEPDSIAVVTGDGDRLRVRTRPGIGTDSKPREPLLQAGTRMLVVDGPVEADGYEWYEVLIDPRDEDLFGWVAAGKDGDQWIAPAAPACTDPDTWPLAIPAIDSLACFGDRPLTFGAQVSEGLGPLSEGTTASDIACPDRVDRGGCDVMREWLRIPGYQFATRGAIGRDNAWVAIPPGSSARDLAMRDGDAVVLSGQWDAPEARDCGVVDPQTGDDVVSRDEAITRCRIVFVVRTLERER